MILGDRSAGPGPAGARPVRTEAARGFRKPRRISAEATGGVERYVGALALKASLFEEVIGDGQVGMLTEQEFYDLAAFITPVRRRIGAWLGRNGFAVMQRRLADLLDGASEIGRG